MLDEINEILQGYQEAYEILKNRKPITQAEGKEIFNEMTLTAQFILSLKSIITASKV